MKLTKDNIQEWKQELDKLMLPYYPLSQTITDEEWLEGYEGDEPESAMEDELFYALQN